MARPCLVAAPPIANTRARTTILATIGQRKIRTTANAVSARTKAAACACPTMLIVRQWCVTVTGRAARAVALVLLLSACGGDGGRRGDELVRFGFWGDTPYRAAEL